MLRLSRALPQTTLALLGVMVASTLVLAAFSGPALSAEHSANPAPIQQASQPFAPVDDTNNPGQIDQVIANFAGQSATQHFSAAEDYYGAGRYDQAMVEYTRAIKLLPDLFPAYHGRGQAHAALNQMDLALADYEKTLQINPNYAQAYLDRGALYFSLPRPRGTLL